MLPKLSQSGVLTLSALVCKEEVRRVVFSMKSYKALGPYGFQPLILKHFWEVVGDDLWSLVKNAFMKGYLDEQLAEILILFPRLINQSI